jgi:carboxyl-terminal processing protease
MLAIAKHDPDHNRKTTRRNPMNFNAQVSALACLVLAGCGGGGGGSVVDAPAVNPATASGYPAAAASCDVAGQRAWLRDYMNDQYFWYSQQGVPDAAASSMSDYFDSLLFAPTDRYSYALSTAEYTQFFVQGRRTGYGYSLAWADTAQTVLKVRTVEALSPVGLAGLRRGDTVVTIDGYTPAQIVKGQPGAVDTAGVARTFVLRDSAGVQRSLVVSSADYPLSPVVDARVITAANGAKVGYLAYQEFISTGAAAVGKAIDSFRAAGVTELVLDLRYNGGGSTTQARNLASLLGGSALSGRVFAQYRFNAKNTASNFSQGFTASTSTLLAAPLETLGRVVIITSGGTASASELVINGLRPFKNIVTIGTTTYGKPYGFLPRDACGTTYSAVNFNTVNAQGFGDYSTGFVPTCTVADDLTRQLGDPTEERIAAALTYIATGVCPVAPQANRAAGPALSSGAEASSSPRNELGFGEVSPRQARLD